MKISKNELRHIIREEIIRLKEGGNDRKIQKLKDKYQDLMQQVFDIQDEPGDYMINMSRAEPLEREMKKIKDKIKKLSS